LLLDYIDKTEVINADAADDIGFIEIYNQVYKYLTLIELSLLEIQTYIYTFVSCSFVTFI